MGVCNNCGNQISDGQLTCPVCGAYTGAGAQANNQTPQQNMYNQQGMYNQAPQQNMYNQQGMYNQAPQQPQKELGMKWFHFVIYFQLFVSALVGLWNGFQLLTGRIYGENTDRVYSYFSGLKGVDTIIGICYIAIAIFALVTRFMLADFKKCGPAMYIGMHHLREYLADCRPALQPLSRPSKCQAADSHTILRWQARLLSKLDDTVGF